MNIFDRPKIDGHCHVLDPQRFPYPAEVPYHPQGQEIGTADYYKHVMAAYGAKHALLVGPNSGYGLDNRCMLDAIAQGEGLFKGIAVVPANISKQALKDFQAQGMWASLSIRLCMAWTITLTSTLCLRICVI
jgi:predicted TIM-barrel fold metal-dependent hydrolase